MTIKVVPLGAGQDVGRSCILVTIGNKNIMFDCGMHMGYNDDRRFPDFSFISKTGKFTQLIDCVIISHFHLDHCGSLPYFSEVLGYDGPIYMTYPTKAICPILLEDFRKITVEKKGETNFFTSQQIKNCMKKVIAVNLQQSIYVDEELEIKAYYAGHVLGAAMFWVRVGNESVVYTGDYNMTPDRHLGGAWLDKVSPTLLITESTYATTIRDSKRQRERDFLKKVHQTVAKGGKVLIPVFALGRAQELCILIDTYWDRMNLNIPIYFSAGLVEKANLYYKLFINWTNQKIKKTFLKRNMFDFKHIYPFDRSMVDAPGGMVLFATPGMLHAGTSLEVFKKWAPSPNNLCILPGYCVVGTVGNKLLAGQKGIVEIDKRTSVDVKCKVSNLSFSAHADTKGIIQLIRQCKPSNVMLVHGEKGKMQFLKEKIIEKFHISVFDPPNGATVIIGSNHQVPVNISGQFLKRQMTLENEEQNGVEPVHKIHKTFKNKTPIHGLILMKRTEQITPVELLTPVEALDRLGVADHTLKFHCSYNIPKHLVPTINLNTLFQSLTQWIQVPPVMLSRDVRSILIQSVTLTLKDPTTLSMSWAFQDEDLAIHCLSIIRKQFEEPIDTKV